MPYTTIVAGTTILASWANASVRDQVVTPFATTSARDSAITSPVDGMLCYITGEDRFYSYDGSAWRRTAWNSASGRTQVLLRRNANQSIPATTLTDISWDTEDSDPDGFITAPSTTLTVPSGLGGLYACTVGLTSSANPGAAGFGQIVPGAASAIRFSLGGGNAVGAWQDRVGTTWVGPLNAAETLKVSVFQDSGAAANFTGYLRLYRIGA
jgi:hypothetical protein